MGMKRLIAGVSACLALAAVPAFAATSNRTAGPVAFHNVAGLHVTLLLL